MNARGRRRFDDPARRIARGLMLLGGSVLLGVAGSTLVAQGGTGQARGQTAARDSVSAAFYAGTTANLRLSPDPMFTARVRCAECHTPAVDSAPASRRIAAMDRVCTTCHGARFAGMLTRWNSGLEWRSRVVADYVKSAAGDSRLAGSSAARGDIRAAQRTLAAIAAANGLHNIHGADGLLRAALDSAAAAYAAARVTAPPRPALGPRVANVSCLTCHYGIEGRRDSVFGQSFDHSVHVVRGAVQCTECHGAVDYFVRQGRGVGRGTPTARAGELTVDPRHGRTMVTASSCSACHHAATPRAGCATCHGNDARLAGPIRLTLTMRLTPPGAPPARAVAFQHARHGTLQCADCHASGTNVASVVACNDCHAQHHQQAADCAACHGTNVRGSHVLNNHLTCTDCHARATMSLVMPDRSFCVLCHAARADHMRGRECSTCHMQSTPAELRRQILGQSR